LAKRILRAEIKNVILFPTTGQRIWKSIRLASLTRAERRVKKNKCSSLSQGKKLPKHLAVSRIKPFFADNMPDAVKLAYQHTKKGKICLLSTASPSFSIFKNYREKGDLFKKYVRKYGR